ncbi:MAG: glycoside hydrolase family 10 protein [Bacteroidota bacterium]|nr:family 10 glycosylhydrolase [Bacteroidota bacterium]
MNLSFIYMRLAALLLLSIFLTAQACKKKSSTGGGTPTPPTPVWDPNAMRGAWITTTASTALDSRDNIRQMVSTCKAAGINHLFVVVYNNARTTYPSATMSALIGKPILERFAGRDPLQECIEEGHAVGLKVHAWFEYGFSSSYSAGGGAIVTAKPHWAARDLSGNLVVKNGFDWLNGIHPEVQQFMVDLFKEVVTNYAIDGVQGDDRLPALPNTGGYDPYTINLYKNENNGASPPTTATDTSWLRWRARKLNNFVKRLRSEVKGIKPTVLFTISPSPHPFGYNEYLQDWPTWVDSSWVDAVLPQCYRYDINGYAAVVQQQKAAHRNPAVPLYPGVLLRSGTYTASAAMLSQMIQTNRNNGLKGESFFFYEGIKDVSSWFAGQYPFIK